MSVLLVSDTAFKKCFGTEGFKAATIGLLNSVLPGMDVEQVAEVTGLSQMEISALK